MTAPGQRPPGVLPGHCWCGCGQKTSIAPRTRRERAQVKGRPVRYVAGHNCSTLPPYTPPPGESPRRRRPPPPQRTPADLRDTRASAIAAAEEWAHLGSVYGMLPTDFAKRMGFETREGVRRLFERHLPATDPLWESFLAAWERENKRNDAMKPPQR